MGLSVGSTPRVLRGCHHQLRKVMRSRTRAKDPGCDLCVPNSQVHTSWPILRAVTWTGYIGAPGEISLIVLCTPYSSWADSESRNGAQTCTVPHKGCPGELAGSPGQQWLLSPTAGHSRERLSACRCHHVTTNELLKGANCLDFRRLHLC